jgi:hypothetical protein
LCNGAVGMWGWRGATAGARPWVRAACGGGKYMWGRAVVGGGCRRVVGGAIRGGGGARGGRWRVWLGGAAPAARMVRAIPPVDGVRGVAVGCDCGGVGWLDDRSGTALTPIQGLAGLGGSRGCVSTMGSNLMIPLPLPLNTPQIHLPQVAGAGGAVGWMGGPTKAGQDGGVVSSEWWGCNSVGGVLLCLLGG